MNDLDKDSLTECEHGWEIMSQTTKEIYLIQETDSKCNTCQLKCTDCNTCIHEYICSCIDSAVKFNMCKHIHLVANLRKNSNLKSESGKLYCYCTIKIPCNSR